MGPRDVRDGKLWIIPKKTEKHGMRICIPLGLRLQAVNWSVGEVIARCRDMALRPRVIHHNAFAGRAKPADGIRPHTISMWFAEARDKAGRSWADGSPPPSFLEIRSLAARLHHEQGINAQSLLGHNPAELTALYRDVREAQWIKVKALRSPAKPTANALIRNAVLSCISVCVHHYGCADKILEKNDISAKRASWMICTAH